MRADVLQLASDLARRGEPFALVTVVRREQPSSARPGDCALVTAGGSFHGWLGGSCTQPTAIRMALDALRDATPRLVALRPDPEGETRPGVIALPMTCHSGGSVDLYVEPVLPTPRLLVFGVSPTAEALVRIGKVLGFYVEAVDPDADIAMFPEADRIVTQLDSKALCQPRADAARVYAVVATLGERDLEAIPLALDFEPDYLGVVASRKRFAELRESLVDRGIRSAKLDSIRSPAGLDIGAALPAEIALSIVAEIVQERQRSSARDAQASPANPIAKIDPVCGMTVAHETAKHETTLGGTTYYFCCGTCRERFVSEPERFVAGAVWPSESES
ncbi:MAG: XdhC family protein [Gemmatimonadales bacterium]